MLEDIGNASAAAFNIGKRMGEQMQVDKAIESWETYAANLQAQLDNARLVIANQNIDLEKLNGQIGAYKEAYEDMKLVVIKKDRQIEEMCAAEIKHKKFVDSKIRSIQRACASQSANSAAYEEIYKLLVLEIQENHDPENFESLDFARRTAIIQGVWDKFAKTGKTYHHPDLKFTYQKNEDGIALK